MNTEVDSALQLEIAPRGGWSGTLLPEQSAEFDLFLRNTGRVPVSAFELFGSLDTPRLLLFDNEGTMIDAYTKAHRYARRGGDLARKRPPVPESTEIPPDAQLNISLNLWAFRAALPSGRYSVQADHKPGTSDPTLTSNLYPFEVVAADVKDVALGYDSAERSSSVTVWAAASRADPTRDRLLIRVSSPKGHAALLQGASFHGEYPAGLRVAVGQALNGGEESGLAWITAVSASKLTFIRHNLSYPYWQSEPIDLPFERCTPFARFPDLGEQAIFLALDDATTRDKICGVLVDEAEGVQSQWTVALPEAPSLMTCSARAKRPVSVLFATNDDAESRVSRLLVSSTGKVVSKPEVLHRTKNRVLALAPAVNPTSGHAFLVVEAQRDRHNRLAVIKIPVNGPIKKRRLRPVKGWPTDESGAPIPVADVQIEETVDGAVGIAFTTAGGTFYAGHLTPKALVAMLRDDPDSRSCFPHLAALDSKVTPSCFTADGQMVFSGSEGSH